MAVVNFEYELEQMRSPSLTVEYFKVPWDTEIIGHPVVEIASLAVVEERTAHSEFSKFAGWLRSEDVHLCSCRIKHDRIQEIALLQEFGFTFIELNYRPEIADLPSQELPLSDVDIATASSDDVGYLVDLAGKTYEYGRFHQDVRLGPDIGNRRYGIWMRNAFSRPTQEVLKCLIDGRLAAFFVVEHSPGDHCHWALVGMTPDFVGRGMAKRVWRGLLHWHRSHGVRSVSTSISSHNVPVLNLYASLGFRFPLPAVTLHWMPARR